MPLNNLKGLPAPATPKKPRASTRNKKAPLTPAPAQTNFDDIAESQATEPAVDTVNAQSPFRGPPQSLPDTSSFTASNANVGSSFYLHTESEDDMVQQVDPTSSLTRIGAAPYTPATPDRDEKQRQVDNEVVMARNICDAYRRISTNDMKMGGIEKSMKELTKQVGDLRKDVNVLQALDIETRRKVGEGEEAHQSMKADLETLTGTVNSLSESLDLSSGWGDLLQEHDAAIALLKQTVAPFHSSRPSAHPPTAPAPVTQRQPRPGPAPRTTARFEPYPSDPQTRRHVGATVTTEDSPQVSPSTVIYGPHSSFTRDSDPTYRARSLIDNLRAPNLVPNDLKYARRITADKFWLVFYSHRAAELFKDAVSRDPPIHGARAEFDPTGVSDAMDVVSSDPLPTPVHGPLLAGLNILSNAMDIVPYSLLSAPDHGPAVPPALNMYD